MSRRTDSVDRFSHLVCQLAAERVVQNRRAAVVSPHNLADLASPSLPGPLCRSCRNCSTGPPVDPTRTDVEYARRQALRLCRSCAALAQCRDWFDALPGHERPLGVIGGQRLCPT